MDLGSIALWISHKNSCNRLFQDLDLGTWYLGLFISTGKWWGEWHNIASCISLMGLCLRGPAYVKTAFLTNHQNQWKNDVILDCSLSKPYMVLRLQIYKHSNIHPNIMGVRCVRIYITHVEIWCSLALTNGLSFSSADYWVLHFHMGIALSKWNHNWLVSWVCIALERIIKNCVLHDNYSAVGRAIHVVCLEMNGNQ